MITEDAILYIKNNNEFTTQELYELGLNQNDISKLIANDNITRVSRGHYNRVKNEVNIGQIFYLLNSHNQGYIKKAKLLIVDYLKQNKKEELMPLVEKCITLDEVGNLARYYNTYNLLKKLDDNAISKVANKLLQKQMAISKKYYTMSIAKYAPVIMELNNLGYLKLSEEEYKLNDYFANCNSDLIDLLNRIIYYFYEHNYKKMNSLITIYLNACQMEAFLPYLKSLVIVSKNNDHNYIFDFFVYAADEYLNNCSQLYSKKIINLYKKEKYDDAKKWLNVVGELQKLGYKSPEWQMLKEIQNSIDKKDKTNIELHNLLANLKANTTSKYFSDNSKNKVYSFLERNGLSTYKNGLNIIFQIADKRGRYKDAYIFLKRIVDGNIDSLCNTCYEKIKVFLQEGKYDIAKLYHKIIIEFINKGEFSNPNMMEHIFLMFNETQIYKFNQVIDCYNNGDYYHFKKSVNNYLFFKNIMRYRELVYGLGNLTSDKWLREFLYSPTHTTIVKIIDSIVPSFCDSINKEENLAKANSYLPLINALINLKLIKKEKLTKVRIYQMKLSRLYDKYNKIDNALIYYNTTNEPLLAIKELFRLTIDEYAIFRLQLVRVFYKKGWLDEASNLMTEIKNDYEGLSSSTKELVDNIEDVEMANIITNNSMIIKRNKFDY